MAKKDESEKVRFVKVHAPHILGRKIGEATITGKYPTLEAAQQSSERGRILNPLQAHHFVNKWNRQYNGKSETK